MYYLNIFFVFSIIGHYVENFVYPKVDSGMLYGKWTPIYGFGVLTILGISFLLSKWKINKYVKPFLLFLITAIFLAFLETLGGYYIEFVFGRIFWSYSHHHFPIGKYTSLDMMVLWGSASLLCVYIIVPLFQYFIKKIPKELTISLLAFFTFDFIYTLIRLSKIFVH